MKKKILSESHKRAIAAGLRGQRRPNQSLRMAGAKNSNYKHNGCVGGKTTSEYSSYRGAKERCNNPNYKQFKDYGGRGIKFLFTSFEQFYAELGPRPAGKTLDRIQNDGNYEPGNVRWSTRREQYFNSRTGLQVSI